MLFWWIDLAPHQSVKKPAWFIGAGLRVETYPRFRRSERWRSVDRRRFRFRKRIRRGPFRGCRGFPGWFSSTRIGRSCALSSVRRSTRGILSSRAGPSRWGPWLGRAGRAWRLPRLGRLRLGWRLSARPGPGATCELRCSPWPQLKETISVKKIEEEARDTRKIAAANLECKRESIRERLGDFRGRQLSEEVLSTFSIRSPFYAADRDGVKVLLLLSSISFIDRGKIYSVCLSRRHCDRWGERERENFCALTWWADSINA